MFNFNFGLDDNRTTNNQCFYLPIIHSGEWSDGKETFNLTGMEYKLKKFPLQFAQQKNELKNALEVLGLTGIPNNQEIKAKLRKLAMRYPPEQNKELHEKWRHAANLLQHPLQILSELS